MFPCSHCLIIYLKIFGYLCCSFSEISLFYCCLSSQLLRTKFVFFLQFDLRGWTLCLLMNTVKLVLVHIIDDWTFLVCVVLSSDLSSFDWNLFSTCCSREWFSDFFVFSISTFDSVIVLSQNFISFINPSECCCSFSYQLFKKVSLWLPIVGSSLSLKPFEMRFSEIQRDKNKLWITFFLFLLSICQA